MPRLPEGAERIDLLPEGTKFDDNKIRLDLLSPWFMEEIAKVLMFGAEKYEAYNWAKGIRYTRVFRALLGHVWDWWRGEQLDQETGFHHLAHAGACLMFLLHYEMRGGRYAEYDDRPLDYYA